MHPVVWQFGNFAFLFFLLVRFEIALGQVVDSFVISHGLLHASKDAKTA